MSAFNNNTFANSNSNTLAVPTPQPLLSSSTYRYSLSSAAGGNSGPSTPMVHTPYSCEHDLVPSYSEATSSHFNSFNAATAGALDTSSNEETGMTHHNSNGSFGHQSSTVESGNGSAIKFSRRSNNSSSAEPESSYTAEAQYHHHAGWDNTTAVAPISSSSYNANSAYASAYNNNNYNYNTQQQSFQQPAVMVTPPAPVASMPMASPSSNFPAFMMRAPIVQNAPVHANHLRGKAEYLDVPTTGAEITTAAQWNRQHKVFVGHVKFEVSADGLRWMIYMLTGVQAGKIEVRGMGCFMVFFATAEEVFKVRGLHKRVLFDVNGIWFAQNLSQEQALQDYATNVAPSIHAKLPKGLMVVDEETSRRRPKNKKNSNNNVASAPVVSTTTAPGTPFSSTAKSSGFQSHANAAFDAHTKSADEMWYSQENGLTMSGDFYSATA